jgi:hypothetical protein
LAEASVELRNHQINDPEQQQATYDEVQPGLDFVIVNHVDSEMVG